LPLLETLVKMLKKYCQNDAGFAGIVLTKTMPDA